VSASPILDLSLFRNRVFRTANAATFFFGAAVMSITIFLPLLLVNVLGVSATRAGAALIPFSAGVVVGATLSGRYVDRIGYRRQLFGGGLLFAASVLLLADLDTGVSYGRVMLYTVLCGVGAGPTMPLFTLAIQNAVDVRMVGQATSASQFFRQIGATVGAAVMGTVLVTTLTMSFSALDLPANVLEGSPVIRSSSCRRGGRVFPKRCGTDTECWRSKLPRPKRRRACGPRGTSSRTGWPTGSWRPSYALRAGSTCSRRASSARDAPDAPNPRAEAPDDPRPGCPAPEWVKCGADRCDDRGMNPDPYAAL
jgi:hypothetical protein